jgi:hypothetical protein
MTTLIMWYLGWMSDFIRLISGEISKEPSGDRRLSQLPLL